MTDSFRFSYNYLINKGEQADIQTLCSLESQLRRFETPEVETVKAIKIDDHRYVSADSNNTIKMWDIGEDGAVTSQQRKSQVSDAVLLRDKKTLALANDSRSFEL